MTNPVHRPVSDDEITQAIEDLGILVSIAPEEGCYAIYDRVIDLLKNFRVLDKAVEVLHLSRPVVNVLQDMGVITVEDLTKVHATDLMKTRGFGKEGLKEIRERLHEHGLDLLL